MTNNLAPVITIDGPSGCGKGTMAHLLAKKLNWHCLDSGAIYRAIGWAMLEYKIRLDEEEKLKTLLKQIQIKIDDSDIDHPQVFCNEKDITQIMRSDAHSSMASQASALLLVRQSVLQFQRDFQRPPGLVTDGRDMGTVVFPHADLKFFLTASLNERARRRYAQLQKLRMSTKLEEITAELEARDQRDRERSLAPTKPADDAIIIDSSDLSIDEVLNKMMETASHFIL